MKNPYNMSEYKLFKGGQGREDDEVRKQGNLLFYLIVVAILSIPLIILGMILAG